MIYKTYIGTKKPPAIILNIAAVLAIVIGVPIMIIMRVLK